MLSVMDPCDGEFLLFIPELPTQGPNEASINRSEALSKLALHE